MTKYSSVDTLPSLTSCVHFSSGTLIPNSLSMAKTMSRKSRLSMPRSSIVWLSGVIESRSISLVSAMILATLSKVVDTLFLDAWYGLGFGLGSLVGFFRQGKGESSPPLAGPQPASAGFSTGIGNKVGTVSRCAARPHHVRGTSRCEETEGRARIRDRAAD